MKKILNFRLAFILAITFMVATVFATYVFIAENLKLIMFLVLLGVFVVFVVLSLIFKRKCLFLAMAIILFVAFPFGSNYFQSKKLNENLKFNEKIVYVQGDVDGSYKFTTNGNLQMTLDNVYVDDGDINKISGKIVLYVNPQNLDISKFEPGATINAKVKFYKISMQDDDLARSISFISKGIVATASVSSYNISVLPADDLSVKDTVKNKVHELLIESNIDYADVGYAMIFGDTNHLDVSIKESFRTTGIAHLLAVSGFHVSIIVLIINFAFKKLKINSKINFIISLIILSFYSYLCDFSVSVVRASLMIVFALYAMMRGKAYDGLSSLSLAAILIMLAKPVNMFNISFVLSFSAVFSIILLSHLLNRIIGCVFYKKVSNALALNIAVQFGLIITNLYYFGKFPTLGIIANFVAVPLASFAFIILFIGVLISTIFPFMSFVLRGFDGLMSVVVKFNHWICSVGKVITFSGVTWISILLMLAVIFVISDYLFVKKKQKAILAGSFSALMISFLFIFT